VRFLEPHGVFELVDGRVSLTGKGRLLRSDSPLWSSLVLRGANDAAWRLDHSLGTGEAAFARAFSADFWSFLAGHPQEQDAFADALRLQSALLSVACVPALDLSGVAAVADVGGGTGDLLAAILEANPSVHGILVDQPEMLARAHPALRAGPLAARSMLRPGDLFGDLPAADAYVLAGVLHNWDDDHAARLLRGLRRAAPPGARLFVLTLLIPEGGGAHPAKTADIGMMALFGGGRERTEAELRDLLALAGWRVTAVTPTRVATVLVATAADPGTGRTRGTGCAASPRRTGRTRLIPSPAGRIHAAPHPPRTPGSRAGAAPAAWSLGSLQAAPVRRRAGFGGRLSTTPWTPVAR